MNEFILPLEKMVEAFRRLPGVGRKSAERMAFGTDYPLWDPVVEMERFMRLKLTDAQKEQIAHITAEEILKV